MLEWANHDLKLRHTELYLDSRTPRPLSFISHAHSDHISLHRHTIATPATLALAGHRLRADAPGNYSATPATTKTSLSFFTSHALDGETTLELLPAGHVLGSAMLHVTRSDGDSLLYTGDFSLQSSLTAEAAAPRPAAHLVLETTYGLPHFKFPPRQLVIDQLLALVESTLRSGRQPIVLGYSLGKAQELTRILTDHHFPVTLHGAPYNLAQIYDRHLAPPPPLAGTQRVPGEVSQPLGRYRKYAYEDFHGPNAIDLRCRGVLIAPPHVARTPFVTRFKNPLTIVMTGWALLKGANFRYGTDHALPFSDHADFPQLLQLIDQVRPTKVYTHHGYTREFADHLRSLGIDARPATPDAQLALFD